MQNLTETDDFLFILKKYQIGKKESRVMHSPE
ncbi:hypothetical protein N786_14775 [Bacillus amyloliquefaciens UASWS BA1]|nr:hypothetical protein KSO_008150 [Bacillus amyloliquefaciens IT-45]AHC42837.1 hypothetical protein U722_12245 [Bacillus amyloliquefaciens LFB112]ERK82349.1 hypothetical protein N786_14775 [Bacillus amyloliquefaciens UASWS BA1]MBB4875127.1 hypothetical protein [Bacillus velezensis]